MSLDFPAMGAALWALSDATGVRPEYILPVLQLESGFDPSIVNSIGCTGINQLCKNIPDGFASWTASQQMSGEVTPMYRALVAKYGAIRSATRAYQANLLPASLPTAKQLSDVVAARGSSATYVGGLTQGAVYTSNAGLDANGDGVITVGDLAAKMAQMVARPAVQSAIAQTYALRPGTSPRDPVYGDDYPQGFFGRLTALDWTLVGVSFAAATAAALVHLRRL